MNALEKSIIHWESIRDSLGEIPAKDFPSGQNCPLCLANDTCKTCIIGQTSGEYCFGTPYREVVNVLSEIWAKRPLSLEDQKNWYFSCQKMITFLKELARKQQDFV